MSDLIFEVERFLRWLAELPGAEKQERSQEISEAAQVFAEGLEEYADEKSANDSGPDEEH